jgi:hypothetical protein
MCVMRSSVTCVLSKLSRSSAFLTRRVSKSKQLIMKPQRKIPFGRRRPGWEDRFNIKMGLGELRCKSVS